MATVREEAPVGTQIYMVKACDRDTNPNYNQVRYSFVTNLSPNFTQCKYILDLSPNFAHCTYILDLSPNLTHCKYILDCIVIQVFHQVNE